MFKLWVETDNTAAHHKQQYEVVRVLREAADQIERRCIIAGKYRDMSGKTIGEYGSIR